MAKTLNNVKTKFMALTLTAALALTLIPAGTDSREFDS